MSTKPSIVEIEGSMRLVVDLYTESPSSYSSAGRDRGIHEVGCRLVYREFVKLQ